MADDWITLNDSFELMLACEQDTELVERLLLPALWEGNLKAVGRRAFIEGALHHNVPIPTKADWQGWPDDNLVLFDWINSRAISPLGFRRTSPNQPSIRHPRIEFYRVEISRRDLKLFWPEAAKGKVSEKIIPHAVTGGPGRPTSLYIISAELERRAAAGERYKTKAEWAKVLHNWFQEAYGNTYPKATSKTIQNKFGGRLTSLLLRAPEISPK